MLFQIVQETQNIIYYHILLLSLCRHNKNKVMAAIVQKGNLKQLFEFILNILKYYIKYIINKIEEMDMDMKGLFTKAKPNVLGKLVGKWKVKKQGQLIHVEIYDKGFLEVIGSDTKSIQFDFDLKFAFVKQTFQIKFQRGKQICIYILNNQSQFQIWRNILKTKINQRGFHQQFKPIKKIGKGNFAAVYLAQKLQDNVSYAVKAFSKQAAYNQENGKQCLIKQIEVMRCLNNINTMKLFQVFESQNSLYIIFELLSGGQLYDKIKAKYKFKPKQVKKIMYGILKGLREMHSKGIMHRDLKPENLLFRKQGQWDCVIADFGLAQFSEIQNYLFVRCGTPGYVAPQVINIKDMKTKYSTICDLYSLGLIYHVLLYGKSAFPGTTYNEVLSQNRAANIDLSGQQYKKVGTQALDLLSQMLKKKPTQRITAEQALAHPYFKGLQTQDQQMVQDISDQNFSDTGIRYGQYADCNSPILTTANPKRKLDKNMKKDSCVDFHMAKQNLLTGKTQEVDSMKSNKVSIANAVSPIRKPKVSQFCVQHK